MLFSRAWQYAIRLLLELAALEPGEQRSAREVARRTDIPEAYASKLLGSLTGARLVRSQRGPGGGVMLARPARDISLAQVAEALGEQERLDGCILGFPECSDEAPCPVHQSWGPMRKTLRESLMARSLADFRLPQDGSKKRRP